MRLIKNINKKNKGQSFIELSLLFLALCIMILGVVELGFLLNQYLELQDTVREVARTASKYSPWTDETRTALEPEYFDRVTKSYEVMSSRSDLKLNPATDEIVLSFYEVNGTTITQLFGSNWKMFPNPSEDTDTRFNDATYLEENLTNKLVAGAPCPGILVVEGIYQYHQLLAAPIIGDYLEDPITVYSFTIMPLSAAEPKDCP